MSVIRRAEADTDRLAESKKAPKKRSMLAPFLVVLVGIAVLLYPVIATQWNNIQQHKAVSEYSRMVQKTDPRAAEREIAAAHVYNATRVTGPILDPWTARLSPDNEPYREYLQQLNLSDVMARLTVPAAKIDLPVFHGTAPETLEQGSGHLFGTDLPVGGKDTHAVITGHTGLQTATLFDNLKDVKKGDSIYLDVYGQKMRYVVYKIEVVLPNEADSLYKVPDRDLVTLVTCTPYGVNSHRLLVHAERAPMDAAGEKALSSGPGLVIQWWMWAFAGIALAAALGFGWMTFHSRKKSEKTEDVAGKVGAVPNNAVEAVADTDEYEVGDEDENA